MGKFNITFFEWEIHPTFRKDKNSKNFIQHKFAKYNNFALFTQEIYPSLHQFLKGFALRHRWLVYDIPVAPGLRPPETLLKRLRNLSMIASTQFKHAFKRAGKKRTIEMRCKIFDTLATFARNPPMIFW